MQQPEFNPNLTGVLFFSRGRGRGHVVPDLAIANELGRLRNDLDLRFVTYATGAATLASLGHSFIDLGLTDANPVIETLVRSARVMAWLKPHLVVVHEEFSALPAAKIFGLPTLLLVDWFVKTEEFNMTLLDYADEIIFLGEPGIFEEPQQAKGKVRYTGWVLPSFSYEKADRSRARKELGLPQDATVISVLPGSWPEKTTPVLDLVIAAFDLLTDPAKTLLWVAGDDYELLSARAKPRSDVIVKREDWQMDRLMVASDLAITKGNRQSCMELAALGIPSISLSYGLNRIDDFCVAHIAPNLSLNPTETDSRALAHHMKTIVAEADTKQAGQTPSTFVPGAGRLAAAKRLAHHIERLRREQQHSASA